MYATRHREHPGRFAAIRRRVQPQLGPEGVGRQLDGGLRDAVRLGPGAIFGREEHHVALFDPVGRGQLGRQPARDLVNAHALVEIVLRGQRPLVGGEEFFALRRARGARQRPTVGAHLDPHDPRRLAEGLRRLPLQAALHHIMPDRRGADAARDLLHRLVVGVAHPRAHRQIGRVADGPRVAIVVGRAGLGGRGAVGQAQERGGVPEHRPPRIEIGQDRGHQVDVLRVQHRLRGCRRHRPRGRDPRRPAGCHRLRAVAAPDRDAVGVQHAGDRAGGQAHAVVRQHRIRAGQLQQRHVAAAEGQRQAVVGPGQRGDADPPGQLFQPLQPHVLQRLDGRDVVRIRQRGAHRDQAMLPVVIVCGHVGRLGAIGKLGADVHERGRGGPVARRLDGADLRRFFGGRRGVHRRRHLERGQVGERLDGRAGLAGGNRHVDLPADLFAVEIRAAHQRQDLAGFGLKRHQRGVARALPG